MQATVRRVANDCRLDGEEKREDFGGKGTLLYSFSAISRYSNMSECVQYFPKMNCPPTLVTLGVIT